MQFSRQRDRRTNIFHWTAYTQNHPESCSLEAVWGFCGMSLHHPCLPFKHLCKFRGSPRAAAGFDQEAAVPSWELQMASAARINALEESSKSGELGACFAWTWKKSSISFKSDGHPSDATYISYIEYDHTYEIYIIHTVWSHYILYITYL